MRKLTALMALSLVSSAIPAVAKTGVGRVVQCEISGDQGQFIGPCLFTPYGHGDFAVERLRGKPFYRGAQSFYLAMETPGTAQAAANDGNGSHFWGQLSRSKAKPACWVDQQSAIYKICAY